MYHDIDIFKNETILPKADPLLFGNGRAEVFDVIGLNPENGKHDAGVFLPFKEATRIELVNYYFKNAIDSSLEFADIIRWFNIQGIYFTTRQW